MTRPTPTLAITGATGRVGGRVARLMSDAGHSQRLVVRDPSRAPGVVAGDVVRATYADAPAVRSALDGVETVFMVSGSEAPERVEDHKTFVDAAAAAGVRHVLYLSFYGASRESTFTLGRDHWATEEHLKASGMAWTFVRDNFYLDFMPELAGEDGVIRGPAGDGRVAAVAQDDVAAVVAAVLTTPAQYADTTLELTGPDSLTLAEAAKELTAALARPITFVNETIEGAYASRAGYGAAPWQLDAWVSTYTAIASGELAALTADVERVTGRPPKGIGDIFFG